MNRLALTGTLLLLLATTACSSRVGKFASFWKRTPVADAVPQPSAVANVMQQQTVGAFNPLSDDARLKNIEAQLKLSPQDSTEHLELARLYEQYAILDRALDQYTRAYNLNQDSLDALRGMSRLGRDLEFLPLVRAFVERHPGDAVALATLASQLDSTPELPAAEKLYRRALELQPGAAWLHNNLGFNLLLQTRVTDATPEFRRALELNPNSQTARNNLGVALVRAGDRAKALEVFAAAGADRATAHNNLAVALLEQDRLEESRAELMESLSARNFFQPALENFKLLLEMDHEREGRAFSIPPAPPRSFDWMLALPKNPPEKDK